MNYEVTIKESSKQLTARERIKMKDTTDCIKLDDVTRDGEVIFKPTDYAVLNVHNEKSDDTEYEQYLVIDSDGNKYLTGSKSFWNTFISIFEEMAGENEEYEIKCYRLPSKNYKDKDFITCSIL